MKALPLIALLATGAAAQADPFIDHARVRSVQPQYESVQMPREQCQSEWVREPRPVAAPQTHNYGGAIIGGVAGAVLGRQIGGGSGRDAATAVGAAVGAMTGDRIANRDPQPYGYGYEEAREVRRCHTVMETQSRLTGYRVQYDYGGRIYNTFTREHPGQTLPVRVSVAPVEPMEREYHRR
jgi:uncharacterized protein YcfJ